MQFSLSGVSKRYASVLAVDDLSFEVNRGEIFAMLGPNGAGKSSTIRMLIGLTQPDSGSLNFSTEQGPRDFLHTDEFGYLPEERGLFQERKILDTLVYLGELKGMAKADAKAEALIWLERLDLLDRQKDQLKTLSKGNQQKVQLISAVLHKPAVVFLDEPFSGLDPINQEKVIEFLLMLREQGMTIVLSAHQMSLVERLADRFLLLNKGQAQLYGTLDEIRKHASLGDTLVLDVGEDADVESMKSLKGVVDVAKEDANSVRLQLYVDCVLPDLLQHVLTTYQVNHLHTERPGLHEIYLSSLTGKEDAA